MTDSTFLTQVATDRDILVARRQDDAAREHIREHLIEQRRSAQVSADCFGSADMRRERGGEIALILRLDQLLNLLASGLFDRIDNGGSEHDALTWLRGGGGAALFDEMPTRTSLDRRIRPVGRELQ